MSFHLRVRNISSLLRRNRLSLSLDLLSHLLLENTLVHRRLIEAQRILRFLRLLLVTSPIEGIERVILRALRSHSLQTKLHFTLSRRGWWWGGEGGVRVVLMHCRIVDWRRHRTGQLIQC